MKVCLLVLAVASSMFVLPGPAMSRPRCDGPYSLNGDLRARYCKSEYVARVAADYGLHVTSEALRNRRSVFQSTCQLIKNDPRVIEICQQGSLGNPLLCSLFGCN